MVMMVVVMARGQEGTPVVVWRDNLCKRNGSGSKISAELRYVSATCLQRWGRDIWINNNDLTGTSLEWCLAGITIPKDPSFKVMVYDELWRHTLWPCQYLFHLKVYLDQTESTSEFRVLRSLLPFTSWRGASSDMTKTHWNPNYSVVPWISHQLPCKILCT